jgi:hypothetical protein
MCALVIAGEVLLLERRRRALRHVADMGDAS